MNTKLNNFTPEILLKILFYNVFEGFDVKIILLCFL